MTTLRWLFPEAPWTKTGHKKVRLYDRTMPLIHAASIMGCDETKLVGICKGNHIAFAPKPYNPMFRAYLSVDDFPIFLRSLKWSEDQIQQGMAQINEVLNRPRGSYTARKEKEEQEEDEDQEEEEEIVPPPSRKRTQRTPDNDEPPRWAIAFLAEVRQAVNQSVESAETCVKMATERGMAALLASPMWKQAKEKRLDEEVKKLKPELRAYWDPIMRDQVEKEHREAKVRELQTNMQSQEVGIMLEAIRTQEQQQQQPIIMSGASKARGTTTTTTNPLSPLLSKEEEEKIWFEQYLQRNQTE